jgi:lipopolysaccharide/colanic/teichoic acid biosynthesis glycosyltransferase
VAGVRVMAEVNLVRSDSGRHRVERFADLTVALIAIFATLPLMVLIALAIRFESAGPIVSRTERFAEGRPYVSLKFRTTSVVRPHSQEFFLANPYRRRTWIGRLLCCTRMENLPQLCNVLRGRMSCFGSRQDRPFFLD